MFDPVVARIMDSSEPPDVDAKATLKSSEQQQVFVIADQRVSSPRLFSSTHPGELLCFSIAESMKGVVSSP